MKNNGVIKIPNSEMGGGGTNLLLMTMGHIINVWSTKPNFKFKTPKCDQNFHCGAFFDFFCWSNYMYNMQHTGRGQGYNYRKNPTGLSMWGDFPGVGSQFFWTLMMR